MIPNADGMSSKERQKEKVKSHTDRQKTYTETERHTQTERLADRHTQTIDMQADTHINTLTDTETELRKICRQIDTQTDM